MSEQPVPNDVTRKDVADDLTRGDVTRNEATHNGVTRKEVTRNEATHNGIARNEVTLCGRLAAVADERELPSGDVVVSVRIIVTRDPSDKTKSRQRVDTLDCVAWQARVQRTMRSWQPGDVVQVDGSLRRRFYRGPSGPVSRTEVEVRRAKRLSRSKPGDADVSELKPRRRSGA